MTANVGFRRDEVLTGSSALVGGARIVAETLAPDARVSEVARRWQICPQHVSGWQRQAQMDVSGKSGDPQTNSSPTFAPIVTEAASVAKPAISAPPPAAIEITPLSTSPHILTRQYACLAFSLRILRIAALVLGHSDQLANLPDE